MRQRLIGIVTVGFGVLLLWTAVPRMIANLLLLPGNSALELLTTGDTITLDGFDRILRSRDAALAWVELPQARIDLGQTLYLMARAADRRRRCRDGAARGPQSVPARPRPGTGQFPGMAVARGREPGAGRPGGGCGSGAAVAGLGTARGPHRLRPAILAFLWDRLAPKESGRSRRTTSARRSASPMRPTSSTRRPRSNGSIWSTSWRPRIRR